jgi:hypothetical protein
LFVVGDSKMMFSVRLLAFLALLVHSLSRFGASSTDTPVGKRFDLLPSGYYILFEQQSVLVCQHFFNYLYYYSLQLFVGQVLLLDERCLTPMAQTMGLRSSTPSTKEKATASWHQRERERENYKIDFGTELNKHLLVIPPHPARW